MWTKTSVVGLFILFLSVCYFYVTRAGSSDVPSSVTEATTKRLEAMETPTFSPQAVTHQPGFLSERAPPIDLKPHPSTAPELEGDVNNEYKIRKDVLAYIDEATKNNERARKACIKYSYYENQVYYHSLNADEAIAWDSKSALAGWCLVKADHDNWYKISSGLSKLMHDTEERKKHMQLIDSKFFAWKILGTGLTELEEDAKCKSGDY